MKKWLCNQALRVLLAFIANHHAHASEWPTASPEEAGFDQAALNDATNFAFHCAEPLKPCATTDALLVIRSGKVVFESYSEAYNKDRPHLLWSASKSFVNALVGIAVKSGKLSLTDKAATYYPALAPGHGEVTIDDLLRMSSGIAFNEGYEFSPFSSSVIQMLYGKGRADMGRFTAGLKTFAPNGRRWSYSSGETNVLVNVLRGALGDQWSKDWAWRVLFEPLGIKSATWEVDGQDNLIGSSYLYTTAREAARFGQLFLDDGVAEGQRLLPEGWVAYSKTPAPAMANTETALDTVKEQYGAHWWVNAGVPERQVPPMWPSAWPDLYSAWGHWGQFIMVVPSERLVVVRFGYDRVVPFDADGFLKRLRASVKAAP